MQNRNLKNMPLWKLALRLGIVFILIVMLIQFFWEWIKTGNLKFIAEAFKNGNWIPSLPFLDLYWQLFTD
jgi:hypothetical protein